MSLRAIYSWGVRKDWVEWAKGELIIEVWNFKRAPFRINFVSEIKQAHLRLDFYQLPDLLPKMSEINPSVPPCPLCPLASPPSFDQVCPYCEILVSKSCWSWPTLSRSQYVSRETPSANDRKPRHEQLYDGSWSRLRWASSPAAFRNQSFVVAGGRIGRWMLFLENGLDE